MVDQDRELAVLAHPLYSVPLPLLLRQRRPRPALWPWVVAIAALVVFAASCLAVLVR